MGLMGAMGYILKGGCIFVVCLSIIRFCSFGVISTKAFIFSLDSRTASARHGGACRQNWQKGSICCDLYERYESVWYSVVDRVFPRFIFSIFLPSYASITLHFWRKNHIQHFLTRIFLLRMRTSGYEASCISVYPLASFTAPANSGRCGVRKKPGFEKIKLGPGENRSPKNRGSGVTESGKNRGPAKNPGFRENGLAQHH